MSIATTLRAAALTAVLTVAGAGFAASADAVGNGVGGFGFEQYPHPGATSTLVLALEAQGGGPLAGATVSVEGTTAVTDAQGRARVTRRWAALRRTYTAVVNVPPPAGGETMRLKFRTTTPELGASDVPALGSPTTTARPAGTITLRLRGEVIGQAERWSRTGGGILAALVPPRGTHGACSRVVRSPLARFTGTGDAAVATIRIRPSAVRGGRWCRGRWTAHVVSSDETVADEALKPVESLLLWGDVEELGVLGIYHAVGDATFTVR
ncbi:hypothetical protein AB0L40_04130 [Patulibacter sp. NPDC049589]|uniref:hypothetical protein n=1 Tax=Patulibacter sp. NPDC049589 TaxID=3154731 RepID=UPI003424DD08